MNAVTSVSIELESMPEAEQALEAVVRELDSAFILEAIQVRASTLTPVMEEILQFRPSSHCRINESAVQIGGIDKTRN